MALLSYIRIGLMGLPALGLLACQQVSNPGAEAATAAQQPPTGAEIPYDTGAVLEQLEYLGNIAYDEPEKVVANPDSFLNHLSTLPVTAEGQEMYAWLLLNIGYALREQGNVLKSAHYYERAMEYCTQHELTEPDRVVYIAKPLGNLYTRIGDLQRALHLHRYGIAVTQKRGQQHLLPAMYTNMAIAYQQIGWTDSVLYACRKGLTYKNDSGASKALLHNIMASAFFSENQHDSASFYSREAIKQFNRRPLSGDTVIWYASSLLQLGLLEAAHQQPVRAIDYLNRAIRLTEQHFPSQKPREKAKYYHARGKLWLQRGDVAHARHDYTRALALFNPGEHTHFPDYTYTEALWGLAQVHTALQSDSATHYYRLAIENAYYTQQLIMSAESHYRNSQWNRQLLAEAMDHLWQSYGNSTSSGRRDSLANMMCWVSELSKGRQLLLEIDRTAHWSADSIPDGLSRQRRALQYLYQQIGMEDDPAARQELQAEAQRLAFEFQLHENHFGQSFDPPDYDAFVRQLALDDDRTMSVSYVATPGKPGFVVTSSGGRLDVHQIPDTLLREIPPFVERYFGETADAYSNHPAQYRETAAALAAALFPAGIPHGKNLLISPDGVLHKLPFDALMQDNRFLIQDHTIGYTYTFLAQGRRQHHAAVRTDLRVFAKERYPGTALPDLPFVAAEVAYLNKRFEAHVHRDAAATDSAFIAALEGGNAIHLAAHAVADGTVSPYIVLDRHITLDNLQYIRAGTPFVFLAACQTAAGRLRQGEGVESLNRAFLSKGVSGVIASYWTVDDQTATDMARSFYDALTTSGSPVAALAQAKRHFLTTASPQAENPWYWASLQFTGTDIPIRLQPKKRTFFWLLGGIGSVGLIFLGIYLSNSRR